MEAVQQDFDAWSRRDAAAIMAVFSDGASADPVCAALSSPAGAYAQTLWAAFPGLSFEIASAGLALENLVAAEWIMGGTNLGSMNRLPPTRRAEAARADFITVQDREIVAVQGYFDRRSVSGQDGPSSDGWGRQLARP